MAFECPVSIHHPKIDFAQTGHKWNLPHDGFGPQTIGFHFDSAKLAIIRHRDEMDLDLFRIITIFGKIFDVMRFKIRVSLFQPFQLGIRDGYRRKFYSLQQLSVSM